MLKKSAYILFHTINEKAVLFNFFTNSLLYLEDSENVERVKDILSNPNTTKKENLSAIEILKNGGFLISDELDEWKILNIKYNHDRFGTNLLSLTILPTTDCEFDCNYCYEKQYTNSCQYMDMITENKIIQFVKNLINLGNPKYLRVTWYGGEPLLQKETIFRLSDDFIKICDNHKIEYCSSMVSNGYNLNLSVAKKLIERKVNNIQLTLDGGRDTHNKRRHLKNGGETYDTILNNIASIVHLFKPLAISIRTNIDASNYKSYSDLLNDLLNAKLRDKVFVNTANTDYYADSENEKCLNQECFLQILQNIEKDKNILGFASSVNKEITRLGTYCDADKFFTFIIGPEGNIYKCWEDVNNPKGIIGNVKDDYTNPFILNGKSLYINKSVYESKKCKKCIFLPYCIGGCPYKKINYNLYSCEYTKINVIKNIEKLVSEYEENKKRT